jgi:non-haem Fe2+, alpha-ketoglutarate-dependent halogenase
MTHALSRFDETGIAFPIPVLDADELRAAREEHARLAAAWDGVLTRLNSLHLHFGWAYDLAAHPRVVDAVSELLGDEVVVWGTLLLAKPPHDDEFVAWHQDGAYAGYLAGTPAVSAWIALSDSNRGNGCMRVVPGSHRTRLDHVETHRPKNMLSRGQEIAAVVDEGEAIDVELRAGEMSLHHVDIVHGSSPNHSPDWRTGFIVRYATPRIAGAPVPLTVARGRGARHLPTLDVRPAMPLAEALAAYQP